MSIEGQGHFFTIYFPGLYVLCFTNVKISGEHLQDQWSSGHFHVPKILQNSVKTDPVVSEKSKF